MSDSSDHGSHHEEETSDGSQEDGVTGNRTELRTAVENLVRLSGRICRRRSLGKHLAFCDVRQEDGSVVKLAFERSSVYWNDDDNFPTKASSLPYGALVKVTAVDVPSKQTLHVHSWKLLENPKLQAQRIASFQDENGNDTGGMECSAYLRERGTLYAMFYDGNTETRMKQPSSEKTPKTTEDVHGGNAHKGRRAKILGQFLVETFGVDALRQGSGVLDVAGGKGQLSIELALHNIPCTLIDPLLRKRAFPNKRSMKHFAKQQLSVPTHCCKCFNQTDFVADYQWLVQNASMLVGLHPDECTEDILDVALQHHRNVVIVPCCVFPTLFPQREYNHKAVLTYQDFLSYLLAKDSRLQMTRLPFEGRNQVIYLRQDI